jgi:conjugative relaxase-like TrwC/TraI family protein
MRSSDAWPHEDRAVTIFWEIVSVRNVLACVCECEEFIDLSEVRRMGGPFGVRPPTWRPGTGSGGAPPQPWVGVVPVIARIKILGMRAANRATLQTAARGIASYLQGGDDEVAADTKRRSLQLTERGAGGSDGDGSRTLGGVLGYYVADEGGRSTGRARGRSAAAMGLTGPVSGQELEAVLMGRHAQSGDALLGASGSSGRSAAVAAGARAVARGGDPDELLSIPEAAFLIGVTPQYLRQLADGQPQTFFATPTDAAQIDERVARRLIEFMCGRPLSSPSQAYLLAQKDPASGHWQVTRREVERFIADRVVPETVMGFDLVCSAPKSVSLLWAVGDDAMRADIAEAFDAAVNATFAYLEQHACFGMVGGRNRPAEGFGVVSFVHDTSRAEEAHLHTHNLIANAVRIALVDDVGKPILDDNANPIALWRAPDSHALLCHVETAGYLGAAELRQQLALRWGVEWGPVRSGVAELAAFPERLLRAFSTRHDQIEEEFARMVEAGLDAGPATEVAAQRSTRAPKKVLADEAVRAVQAAKLSDIGWSAGRVQALVEGGKTRPVAVDPADVAELHARLVGPLGLTERQTTFTSRDVHQAVAAWARDRCRRRRSVRWRRASWPTRLWCCAGSRNGSGPARTPRRCSRPSRCSPPRTTSSPSTAKRESTTAPSRTPRSPTR